ncbi:conserved hypothetical protein [Talaromyces stipitatus ATCC 10500]|uniref:BZIP domain-containing protein n=1 Tax=Talaromyces stipitatus (strain ATCC 10500 / CBS 375.48 / QM 6759 / NRRL 1006) TaxID=441959 RepID=B8LVP5_TALSN|nr:uncharacterized protein TSTA_075470 [Talaromyces stipitatus ATCC 10500]EED24175.1 conserved hypothetical protein [Talaromyces stipitatus ATCC 10500]
MSDSGDSSKAEKKREYNRNAQRLFRQRRKEHLKSLERADKERSSSHAEELQRLREDIEQLRAENRALKSCSKISSPHASSVPSSVVMPGSPSPYPTSPFRSLELYDSAHGSDDLVRSPSEIQGEELYQERHEYRARGHRSRQTTGPDSFCALFPQDISLVRRNLHLQLAPVLDLHIISNPQLHLSTLAAIGPSLPPALQPTLLQLQTPHHAYIDLIPSPNLRDALIQAGFAVANSFLTEVCTFVYETEDLGQLTIWGRDYLNVMSWEFSEGVLKAWPNLLTAEWRERANFWRAQRSEPLIIFD